MLMNNRKRDILYMFIATVPLSAVLAAILIICEQGAKLYMALLPQLGMCGIIGIMLMQEKYIENQNEIYRNRLDAEMRQQVLENYESDGYRNINADNMSDDLKMIFRRSIAPFFFIYGIGASLLLMFLIYLVSSLSARKDIMTVFTIGGTAIVAFGCFALGIYQFTGGTVSYFLNKEKTNLDMIERSYMGGSMICGWLSGINIGIDHCVIYDSTSVSTVKNEDILHVNINKRITKKRDRSGFVVKDKKDISAQLVMRNKDNTYNINVTELQLEFLCDEFMRRGIKIIKNY